MQVENSAAARHYREMTFWKWGQCLALGFLIGSGCGSADRPDAKATAPNPPKAAPSTNAAAACPTEAQPKLRTIKLWVGAEELITEIAATQKEIIAGMMHRKSMEENEAMLFVFPYPHQTSFWMKNTLVPLSCAYIDPDGVILEIYDLQPHNTNSVKAASKNVQYVLETSQGWFQRHNIGTGTLVRTDKGDLRK